MKLHTLQEILEDVWNAEGVDVDVPPTTNMFTRLYTETYTLACIGYRGEALRREVTHRVNCMLRGEHSNKMPQVDRQPDPYCSASIYVSTKPIAVDEEGLVLFHTSTSTAELAENFPYGHLFPVFFIVHHQRKEVVRIEN